MSGDWVVAGILLVICLVFILTMVLICRLLGFWKPSNLFAQNEEKTGLTKNEQRNGCGYTVADSEAGVSNMGGSVQYSTIGADVAEPVAASYPIADYPPPVEEKDSPGAQSVDSIGSDFEPPSGPLQRAMSCDSVASDSSVMDWDPEAPKIGQLEFGIEYDREIGELVVSVIQGRDLEVSEVTGTIDSYVKIWLSPHKDGRFQTKIIKDTPNPIFMERFLVPVDAAVLDDLLVQFQVYSCDKYARHKLLGETDLRLGDIDLRQPIRVWMNLRDMDEKPKEIGDMMFSLSYLPTAERLTVVVVKARNIRWAHGKEQGDCFVKVYLLQNGKKVGKKKTSTKRREKNPIFNEAMIFSVPANALQTVQLRISVMENVPDGKVGSVGHVIVGSQLSGTELTHWNQMMTSLRKPVAMWHSLKK